MKIRVRQIIWMVAGIAVVVMVVRAFQPVPVMADTALVRRQTLQVTVDDDGMTRVRERYTISAPIQGRLLRTPLDAGDPVHAGETPVAEFVPISPDLLDARSRGEAVARQRRAEAALSEAEARQEQARAALDLAVADIARVRDLVSRDMASVERFDQADHEHRSAVQGLRAAEFAVQVARYELDVARASLRESDAQDLAGELPRAHPEEGRDEGSNGRLELLSPVDGHVLRVFEESARTLAAGSPILEVGNTAALEIVADYLSQDAVRVRPRMLVLIRGWGGDGDLRGVVRRVEPGGFTKISALGVEEQRVNIVVDPVGDATEWSALGDGYRVELRILLWEQDDVLVVPTGALFHEGGTWAVFVLDAGKARRRALRLGQRNGLEAQVLEGLSPGDRVVLYPSELIGDGTSVDPR